MKTMLMNAALGAGSELIIDAAAGVDWTAAIAVVYGIQQACPHWRLVTIMATIAVVSQHVQLLQGS